MIEELLIKNGEELLGLKVLVTNYSLNKQNIDLISILALDEVYQLVIVEYRKGKYNQTIGRGLMQLDYINEHESEFKLLISDLKLGLEKKVIYKPRLLVIGEDFSEYDLYAIRQLPYPIELIKVQTYEEGLVILNKQFVSLKTQTFKFNVPAHYHQLFNELCEFIFSLGDEVVGIGFNNTYTFRKIKAFLRVEFLDTIVLSYQKAGQLVISQVSKRSELENIYHHLEEAYNEG